MATDIHGHMSAMHDVAAPPIHTSNPLPVALSFAELQRAVSHEGGLERLRCLLAKLRSGANVSIAVLGGSVSAGSSSRVRNDQSGLYHRKLHRWLQTRYPQARVTHVNAAMPAVPPGYMELCLSLHVPGDVDLVLLEAAANMCGKNAAARADADANGAPASACDLGRESVERMLRQVLSYPHAPAVVMVHAYARLQGSDQNQTRVLHCAQHNTDPSSCAPHTIRAL